MPGESFCFLTACGQRRSGEELLSGRDNFGVCEAKYHYSEIITITKNLGCSEPSANAAVMIG